MNTPRMSDGRAVHTFPLTAQEEKCRCGRWAAHKIEETSGPGGFHPLTAYLCCEHFRSAVGGAHDSYPYDYDEYVARLKGDA